MPESAIPTKRAIRFLASHLRRHALSLAGGFVVLVAVDSLQLIIPRIIQSILDRLSAADYTRAFVVKNSVVILALAAAMVGLRFLWRLFIVKPSRQIEERMRLDLFDRLELLSAPFYNRTKTGDLMALFINDIGAIRMATGMALIGLFDAVFLSVMSLAFMIAISPLLTLAVALPMPFIIFMFLRTGRTIEKRYAAVQGSFGALSTHTQESFSGVRVIKSFAQEQNELGRMRDASEAYVQQNLSLTKIWGVIFPAITFLASLSFTLLLIAGSRQVMSGRLTIGEFVSFTFYINLLVWPMIATGWVWNLFQRGLASSKRLLEVLDTQPDVRVAAPAQETPAPLRGAIEIRGLSFCYAPSSVPALQDVTLKVPAGSSLGIIGRPGSGKTTLASLLFHLYPVERGRLLIDERDINDIPLPTLRRSIAYVPQDSFLFSDTIAANIGFGLAAAGADRSRAEAAAAAAAIHGDIMHFSRGYDTRVGERGVMLSGGQRQRIAIARALALEGAGILVLDDALSSVDVATEAAILRNLAPTIRGRTAVIIAHRISTVQQCDAIIVLEGGRIVEQGTHAELVAAEGFYTTLFELQRMKGRESA